MASIDLVILVVFTVGALCGMIIAIFAQQFVDDAQEKSKDVEQQ